ncbi:MAG: hypothetical protein M3198_17070 [Actinomycetota bacterium]|nr:hypothetical protein [Actinomycetota bacterium]
MASHKAVARAFIEGLLPQSDNLQAEGRWEKAFEHHHLGFRYQPGAVLWAPSAHLIRARRVRPWVLYYTATDRTTGKHAIGVATAAKPEGPWTADPDPVVKGVPGHPGYSEGVGEADKRSYSVMTASGSGIRRAAGPTCCGRSGE